MAVSSGVWAEAIPLQTAWGLREVSSRDGQPKSMKEELDRIGYTGECAASYRTNPFAAHFELHIERGPILEDLKQKLGVAFKWFNITVKGRDSHAGTTPLSARKDPVLCASKLVVAANTVAHDFSGFATTGIFTTDPGSVNTMPHTAKFSLDMRHVEDAVLGEMVRRCEEELERIGKDDSGQGCIVEWKLLFDSPAVQFHPDCIAAVEASAADVCSTLPEAGEHKLFRPIISGAGHDSCYTNLQVPISMVFTLTREGISHNPTEYCSSEDWYDYSHHPDLLNESDMCKARWVPNVLLGTVLRYDKLRAGKQMP
ncbi:hydantoinase/carbamoylase family amidase [Colletotrichum orchidophilum]|uniref:Hydantoinase/carbamoylase family amidase n=1 Tax=Colletotrichum orchidophilum TaxID=1209926 RepID=A0A1G4B4D4_9PEZI|nr:hydantoinase/carbamoylase family amidase [Colletotrichum orchidophilum]OHE96257.1 hydantoinase/carbamoylase family amidase [Colletotrichum orchidophilum]